MEEWDSFAERRSLHYDEFAGRPVSGIPLFVNPDSRL